MAHQYFVSCILKLKTTMSYLQDTKTGFHTKCGKYKFQQKYDLWTLQHGTGTATGTGNDVMLYIITILFIQSTFLFKSTYRNRYLHYTLQVYLQIILIKVLTNLYIIIWILIFARNVLLLLVSVFIWFLSIFYLGSR